MCLTVEGLVRRLHEELCCFLEGPNKRFEAHCFSENQIKNVILGTSLAIQWFRLCASTAGGADSVSGGGIKILHATQHGRKVKKKKESFWLWCLRFGCHLQDSSLRWNPKLRVNKLKKLKANTKNTI